MKIQFFLVSIFCALNANAQDYLITFSGSGASTSVSTVKVENLTAGTSLNINGNDILHLKSIVTGVNTIKDDQSSDIKIYPNPMSDNSTMQIYAPVAGDALITVLDITGKPVARIQSYLENSRQDFNLAGLKTGFYIINVKGNNYQLSEKLLSNGQSGGTIRIEKVNVVIKKTEEKAPEKVSKGLQPTVDMAYTTGDRLKFTGISGNYSTVKMDIPTSDKTIAFNFIYCTDGDNNNYPVVEIGDQIWMAENLKTTRYYDGTAVNLVSDANSWDHSSAAYCWYGNDEVTYKDTYGALYNCTAIKTEKLCPAGWYQPYETDWRVLTDYLTNNGYGYGGSGNVIAKSLAATTNWSVSSIEEVESIGNNMADNNSTGFTALPAGERTSSGEFHYIGSYASWWGCYDRWMYESSEHSLNGPYMFNRDSIVSKLNSSLSSGHSVRCLLGKSLTTAAVTNITQTTAISGGIIKNDAGAPVIVRGVCWRTSPNPTIADNKTINGSGTGTFTSSISGISSNTTYFIRAYATNSLGTIYGDEIIFKTYFGIVSDIDGNVYQTVKIGTQIWIAENLKTTRYNDSEIIPLVQSNTLISLTTPGYSWYNNDEATYKDTYGALYNSYAVSTEKLCPVGWYVPTNAEWTILTEYLTNNGYGYGGSGDDISKSMAAPSGWEADYDGNYSPSGVGHYQLNNNSSGFTGIPIATYKANWWTSSGDEFMIFTDESIPKRAIGDGRGTSSVRCLKEELNDRDGNVYSTVKIGTQVWMGENLKTTKYNNGDLIGTTSNATKDIRTEDTPEYQWAYNGNENNADIYGRLYTWYAVNDSRNVCPVHWHVPTQAEWTTLTDYLGGQSIAGGKLKEAGTNHWMSPNTGTTNETRFTALPGGYRLSSGGFGGLGSDGAWRSSTMNIANEDWTIGMGNSYTDTYGSNNSKRSGYSIRCIRGDLQVLPVLSTIALNNLTQTTAATGGNVTSEGFTPVSERGVCWSTSTNPTITNSKTINGSGIGTFSSSLTGLTANTIYYVRSFATNSYGTNYGDELVLKTYGGTITDIDGNVYNTVTIGTQIWMVENLKTTKYNDGALIPLVTDATEWSNVTTDAFCWNDNDPVSYKNTYGALYNWYTVKTGKLCPTGWHIPADAEWATLTTCLGGESVAGGKLKEPGITHWKYSNPGATNESGFRALAGGERFYTGLFSLFGIYGYWWSSTEYNAGAAWVFSLYNNSSRLYRNYQGEKNGFSVRCLKDN